jgi:uncharacterized zinc-type alcohol dehydrogenase-like protein
VLESLNSSKDAAAIEKLADSFGLLTSIVNMQLDWDALIGTLAPNGRLHFVGAVLEPIPVAAFALILQQQSVSGSPVANRDDTRLCFTAPGRAADRALPDEQANPCAADAQEGADAAHTASMGKGIP